MAPCEFNHLGDLGFRDLVGENAADTHAVTMDMEHDLHGFFAGLVKELLQYVDDELHRRVVVVKKEHLVHARLLGFRARFRDDTRSGVALTVASSLPAAASVSSVSHPDQSQA